MSDSQHARQGSVDKAKAALTRTTSRLLSIGRRSRNPSSDDYSNGGSGEGDGDGADPISPPDENINPMNDTSVSEKIPRKEGEFGEERDGWRG